MNYVFTILILAYLYVSIRNQIEISKSEMISKRQKVINSILLWMIPFIWAIIVRESLKPLEGSLLRNRKKGGTGSSMDDAGAIGQESD